MRFEGERGERWTGISICHCRSLAHFSPNYNKRNTLTPGSFPDSQYQHLSHLCFQSSPVLKPHPVICMLHGPLEHIREIKHQPPLPPARSPNSQTSSAGHSLLGSPLTRADITDEMSLPHEFKHVRSRSTGSASALIDQGHVFSQKVSVRLRMWAAGNSPSVVSFLLSSLFQHTPPRVAALPFFWWLENGQVMKTSCMGTSKPILSKNYGK